MNECIFIWEKNKNSGHIASEAVIVELVNSNCLPSLLYGLEPCPLKSADLKSLDYIVVGAFMKIVKTKSKEVASCCMEMFNYPLPSVIVLIALSNVLMFHAAD